MAAAAPLPPKRLPAGARAAPLQRLRRWVRGEPPPPAVPPAPPVPVRARVLMVCMGNICRSPTAEAVLREKLRRAGVHGIEVDSAGTHGEGHAGEAPDPRAQRAALARGYDLSALRARALRDDDFRRFDHLLAMDDDNLRWLHRRAEAIGSPARAALLMTAAPRLAEVAQVPDPYYGSPAGFDRVLDLIEDACDGWIERLREPAR